MSVETGSVREQAEGLLVVRFTTEAPALLVQASDINRVFGALKSEGYACYRWMNDALHMFANRNGPDYLHSISFRQGRPSGDWVIVFLASRANTYDILGFAYAEPFTENDLVHQVLLSEATR